MNKEKRIYYPEDICETFNQDWFGSHLRKESLKIREIEYGTVLHPFKVPNPFGGFYMETSVLSSKGELIDNSGMFSGYAINTNHSFEKNDKFYDETVIYCGIMYFHYGHFLIQSTTRLYYALHNLNYKIVFVVSYIPKKLPSYIIEFFKLCGIPLSRIVLIDKSVQFKKIIIPDISSKYFKDWTPEFLIPFKKAAESVLAANDEKIFFSRKKWNGIAKCFGEDSLEKLFVQNGFKPVMLETLSLSQQIACIKGAKILAGINGTSFHNILFGDPGKKLIFLNRNPEYDSQYILNDACSADWYVVKVHANPLPVNHPHGPFIVGLTTELREFCKEHGLKCGNIFFHPEKYLDKFCKRFILIYAQNNCLREYQARYNNCLPVDSLISMLIASYQKNYFILLFYRILGKIFPGKLGDNFRVLYAAFKDQSKHNNQWKY